MIFRKLCRHTITFSRRSILIVTFFIFPLIYTLFRQTKSDTLIQKEKPPLSLLFETTTSNAVLSKSELHIKLLRAKVERLASKVKSRAIVFNNKALNPNYNTHIFYYGWYGNTPVDGYYKHWNHTYLPQWEQDGKIYPKGSHSPILDIGSNFYPSLGCYSSQDPKVIEMHMKQLREAGVGVIVISWTPPNYTDSPSTILPLLFQYAKLYEIKIALHIEPYFNRNPINLIHHLHPFLSQYGNNVALYRMKKGNRHLPVFYIYDSYLTPAISWMEILTPEGAFSVRGGRMDAIFLGLLVDIQHRYHIKKSHFDGFYTYFAANSFSYGSTWKNWKTLAKFAKQNELIFIPSVGPGYEDTQVRPWNTKNIRQRRQGQYYDVAWRSAINSNVKYISITSFNEWHEGTQIEPAIPMKTSRFTYLDYEPMGSYFYLNLTKWWNEQFTKTLLKY
ncbi:hypothetical protein PPYR_04628 [Photinus pyralis]|uniref:Glycoprotein endo-alpha-1,2-mannosidase n=1 Tax=Photinus pyralis TaxID=7054 RepID=A0A5N4AYK0_PHOPY|nr:glycoprotein endo-alpha-1,2-mannosidase [Photinus pyralis]KAB0802442.1 hypothetical protein PPYR_04628 [Photinus pyralis]